MINDIKSLIKEFYKYAKQQLKFSHPIKIILKQDDINAQDPLGKTGYYDPDQFSITLFITKRHPKDILRSLAHECVHCYQHQSGQFKDNQFGVGENYFQKNKYMRELEREAFEKGNMMFRQWEEIKKQNR